jgi:medium-chain acyl-[acyl-carrier-protein] hydrolase
VCLPYAGAGASVFRAWPDHVPDEIDVCAVQLPGRQDRLREPPLKRTEAIVAEIALRLAGCFALPTILYGHSFGAVIGFEVARLLEARGSSLATLVVGARRAPPLPARHEPIRGLSEERFLEAIHRRYGIPWSLLRNRELVEIALPPLRADLEALEEYEYVEGRPLDAPLTVLSGTHDTSVPLEDAKAWSAVARAPISLQQVDGGHFFVDSHRPWVIDRVLESFARSERDRPDLTTIPFHA